MYHSEQIQGQISHLDKLSSDQEYENQKSSNLSKNKNPFPINPNSDEVIDQKEQVRQVSVRLKIDEEQILHQLIKEEHLSELQTKYEESQIQSEKQIIDDLSTFVQQDAIQKTKPKQQGFQHIIIESNHLSPHNSNQKAPIPKNLAKSISSTSLSSTKYLQSNSPELFISPQSLLPNEIICIENNSTRVIVHMNKKIVPIPSSYVNDPTNKSQSPSKSHATLPSVQCPYLLGKLVVTNYKLVYLDSLYPNTMTLCLPLNYILKIQRTNEQSTGISYIEIWFKTGLSLKLKYHPQQFSYSQKIKDIIITLMHKNLYAAIDLGQQEKQKPFLCKKFADRYFEEQNIRKVIKNIQAQIVDNDNWQQVASYPEKYVVPMHYIGKKNSQTRLVILSYLYTFQNQKFTLWRTGPGNPEPFEEEWIAKARFSNRHYIIEVRNKGIGISKSQATRLIQIESLYLLRQSFQKVHQLNYHNHESMKWLGSLCGTKWYEQVATIMNEALHIIQVMSSKTNVTLVCDTEGRGAQITGIVQLLMNPYYRTFEGFPCLIEKEFLHYGCPKPGKKQREQDKAIILIQFLDCVFQFSHLYPLSFEFSEHYLVFLAEHILSNKYGNFLFITRQLKKESDRRQVVEKCVSIWQDIRRKIQTDKKVFLQIEQIKKPVTKKAGKKSFVNRPIHENVNYYIYFRNSFYIDHNESNIFQLRNQSELSKGIKLWSAYFSKKVYCTQLIKEQVLFCNQIEKRYFKIAHEHNLMKKYNQIMRKKLSEQYSKVAQKKQIIKSLKEL